MRNILKMKFWIYLPVATIISGSVGVITSGDPIPHLTIVVLSIILLINDLIRMIQEDKNAEI